LPTFISDSRGSNGRCFGIRHSRVARRNGAGRDRRLGVILNGDGLGEAVGVAATVSRGPGAHNGPVAISPGGALVEVHRHSSVAVVIVRYRCSSLHIWTA